MIINLQREKKSVEIGQPAPQKRCRVVLSKTFLRFALPYLAILIVVIACLGAYMFTYFADTIEKSFYENEASLLDRIRYSHEIGLNGIVNMVDQITFHPEIEPFRLSAGSGPLRARELISFMSLFRSINGFVSDLFLVFDIDEYIYSPSTSMHMDRFLEQGIIYEGISPQDLRSMLHAPKELSIIPAQKVSGILSGNKKVITFILPTGTTKSGTMMFIVDEKQYMGMLAQELSGDRGTYILHGGKILAQHAAFEIPDAAVEDFLLGKPQTATGSLFYEGEEYLVTAISDSNGMRYCTVQQRSALMESLSLQQRRFWILLAVTGLVSVMMIGFFSMYNYKPVRTLRSLMGDARARDDFKAIEMGIREIKAQNQALASKSVSLEKSELIRRLVNGSYGSKEDFLREAERLGIGAQKRWFAIALLSAHTDISGLLSASGDCMVGENISGHCVELTLQNQVLFALFSDDEGELFRYAQEIHHIVRSQQRNTTMAISKAHSDIAHASIAYLEAAAAFDNRFVLGNGSVLHFDDVTTTGSTVSYPAKLMSALKNVLRRGNLRRVDDMLDELIRYMQTMNLSLFAFRSFYNDIISVVMNECAPAGTASGAEIYDVFSLSRCLSIDDLNETLRSVCHSLLGDVSQAEGDGLSTIRMAESYMQENYDDPNLSMAFLAEHLSMSARAFSEQFKEQMGVSPSEYLVQIRLYKAKKLLAETQLSVKEIGVRVGYHDVSGFIRRFRHYTGMTPINYRQQVTSR